VDPRILIEPPIKPPMLIAMALGGMIVVLLFVYIFAYRSSTTDLKKHFDSIVNQLQQK
jgi:hypothetical protein